MLLLSSVTLPLRSFSFPFCLLAVHSSLLLHPFQAQLIHDRNTASHATINDKADAGPERVHMTWTKDKLFTERNRNRECNANMAVRDLFNMKP